jgi:glycosyltransferase involved in cell wall biosynthesis
VRFAFVTPRYGADITVGAEHACRLLAEQVCQRHAVDVITTCASDPATWRNAYSEGVDRVRGVIVRRFVVNQLHDDVAFQQLSSRLSADVHGRDDELEWVRQLGPSSPGLIDYLKRHQRAYDAVVFFSLYHSTTVLGLAAAPDQSILFPYLRLGSALRFSLWSEVLGSAKSVGYLSSAERSLTHRFLRIRPVNEEVVGIGVEMLSQQTYPRHQQNPADALSDDHDTDEEEDTDPPVEEPDYLAGRGIPFRRRHRLYGSFALYGGRVESDNGCEEMLEYFDGFNATDGDTSLVLMGVKLMNVPQEPYIRMGGVLPDRDRMIAYEAANITVAPDPDDLLAQPVLESLAVGTPVLANARNAASVELCRNANAGLYYSSRAEFVEGMRILTTNTRLRERMGENGREYVRQHHRWDVVLSRFDRLVTKARGR